MKKAKKGISLAKTLVFLLCVFVLVMLYVVLAYPKLTMKIAEVEAKQMLVQTQTRLLEPYEQKLGELLEKEKAFTLGYEKDTSLTVPVAFSDIIYAAAADSGFTVRTLQIEDAGPLVTAQDYEAAMYTASVTLDMQSGFQAPDFIAELEANGGAGIYVTGLEYSYPTDITSGIMTAQISMYTIAK